MKLNTITVLMLAAISQQGYAEETYSFSDSFIKGKHIKADLSKYTDSAMKEGIYSLDTYVNGEWKGRFDLKVEKQETGDIDICYNKDMLIKLGISPSQLNSILANEDNRCALLSLWNDDKEIKSHISKDTLRLDISIPQIYQDQTYIGYIDPSKWEKGITALNVGWDGNIWNAHYNAKEISDYTTGYLGLNATASSHGWSLKHNGAVTWSEEDSLKWKSNKTYLQKPFSSMKSILSVGQITGTGDFFDTITLRGVSLKTDDAMFPDNAVNFSPEIRGEARTNALVTVRQNGNIIHQTTVPPGAFNLKNVYPSGFGNSLEVSVKEADGEITYFSVPYNSVSHLLRPGMFRYELLVGKPDNPYLTNKPIIYQATGQYGVNNFITSYVGVTGYDQYQSYLIGSGINTPIGGFSLDATMSKLEMKQNTETGKMYRLSYTRNFDITNTSIYLTGIKYDSKGFYNLSDSLNKVSDNRYRYRNEKSDMSLSINQTLPDNWGSLYVTGRQVTYWDKGDKRQQYQVGYSHHFGHLSYSLSVQKTQRFSAGKSSSENRIGLNISLPLNFGENRATLSSRTTVIPKRGVGTQLGLTGSLGDQHDITYGVNTTLEKTKNVSVNGGYRTGFATLNGSIGQGSDYRQTALTGSGSFVVHNEGITFTPETSDTFALVKAENAKGARINGSLGSRIDGNGFGLVSTVRPYRTNAIEIDPKEASENVYFNETMKQSVPYENSIVKINFETEMQDNVLIKGKLTNGKPLPFGSSVYNDKGEEIGMIGQGGIAFIKNATSKKGIVKWETGTCTLHFTKDQKEVSLCE